MNGIFSPEIMGILAQQEQGAIDPKTAGILQMGLGLLSSNGGPQGAGSLGRAIGQSGQQGMLAYQQAMQHQRANILQRLQMTKLASDLEDTQKHRAAVEEFGKSLPPDKQAAFKANPKAFIEEMFKLHNLRPGSQLVSGSGSLAYSAAPEQKLINQEVAGPDGAPVNRSFWATPGQPIPDTPRPVKQEFLNTGPTQQGVNPYTGALGTGLKVGVSPNTAFTQGQENWRMQNKPILLQGADASGNLGGVLTTPAAVAGQGGALSTNLRPTGAATASNAESRKLRAEWNADPIVKKANFFDSRIGPIATYVASGKSDAINDQELVKLWLASTHPQGDQITRLDTMEIAKTPDLMDRIRNVASGFVFGKTLAPATRAAMWNTIQQQYKEADTLRNKRKQDITSRANAGRLNVDVIFGKEEE